MYQMIICEFLNVLNESIHSVFPDGGAYLPVWLSEWNRQERFWDWVIFHMYP